MRKSLLCLAMTASYLVACGQQPTAGEIADAEETVAEEQSTQEHMPPETPGPQSGEKSFAPDLNSSPVVTADRAITGDDLRDLNAWTAASTAILTSPRFRTNMTALAGNFPNIWLSGEVGTMTPAALHQLLTNASGDYRYLATRQVWRTDQQHKISVGSDPQNRHRTAIMYIGRNHLGRYRSTDAVERSCAINSMVHEITHTISRSLTKFDYAVTDTGSGRIGAGKNPYASYFVGTVAQCSHLQDIRRIGEGDLMQCINTFGTRDFRNKRCDKYKNGEPVQPPAPRPRRTKGKSSSSGG